MADVTEFETEPRQTGTKGDRRALRLSGRVPGVVYGDRKEQQLISVESRVLRRAMQSARFSSTLVNLKIDGRAVQALPREVQTHPVLDEPIHIDFQRIGAGSSVTVTVPVVFVGEEDSPGLKQGGVLNIVRREVELTCPADAIPERITIDVSKAAINDSLHISQATIPANVELTISDRDFTVATIAPPTLTPEDEDEKAEAEAAAEAEAEAPVEEGEGEAPAESEAGAGGEEEPKEG